jgi:hypothetical protein
MALFAWAFFNLWPPKAVADYQTLQTFQPACIRIALVKTIQNQHEHRIDRVVTIVEIRRFLDLEPFRPLYLPPAYNSYDTQILPIAKFSPHPDSQKSWLEKN